MKYISLHQLQEERQRQKEEQKKRMEEARVRTRATGWLTINIIIKCVYM